MEKEKELYNFIKKTIAEVAEFPEEKINDNSHFQIDLDMDSLEAVEVLHKIEKKYKKKITQIELDEVQTLSGIYEICKNIIFT